MSPENESKNRVSDFIKSLSKHNNNPTMDSHSHDKRVMTKDSSRNGLYYMKSYFENVNKRQYIQFFSTFTDAMFIEVRTQFGLITIFSIVVTTLLDERIENR